MESHQKRYQVFISSTFLDLEHERRKVLEAVLECRAFPSGMEMFPSADDEQWEFIKREIDSSDYYVLVVAGKYGSVAADGTSYTEKEYRYAVERKKPILTFLYKDIKELKVLQAESDPERKEKLERFRETVSARRLVKYYSNPDELKTQVLQGLHNAFDLRPAEGWVKARNARRIEDLEQINQLQNALMQAEKELEELRRDPTEGLAQGNDRIERRFRLSNGLLGEDDPPGSAFDLSITWDELIVSLFPGGVAINPYEGSTARITTILINEFKKQDPGTTNKTATRFSPKFDKVEVEQFANDVRLQLKGLGLMKSNILNWNEGWELTQAGLLRCAMIAGQRRPQANKIADGQKPSVD